MRPYQKWSGEAQQASITFCCPAQHFEPTATIKKLADLKEKSLFLTSQKNQKSWHTLHGNPQLSLSNSCPLYTSI